MSRTLFARYFVTLLLLLSLSSSLGSTAWASGKTGGPAAPTAATAPITVAAHAGPVEALWNWLRRLLVPITTSVGSPLQRPDAGGCTNPNGGPCV